MRRKSNFAPSDSEEREDERCTGLHSNDMVEMGVCFRMQGCGKCICVYVCMGIHSHVYYPTRPSRERQSCHFSIVESAFYWIGSSHCMLTLNMKVFNGYFQPSCLMDMLGPANKSQNG